MRSYSADDGVQQSVLSPPFFLCCFILDAQTSKLAQGDGHGKYITISRESRTYICAIRKTAVTTRGPHDVTAPVLSHELHGSWIRVTVALSEQDDDRRVAGWRKGWLSRVHVLNVDRCSPAEVEAKILVLRAPYC